MAENSKIEWTDHTHNFWVGCSKVSAACDWCYAESWAKRAGHPELWQGERRRTADANWRKPLKWNAEAAAKGIRYRVFTNSLADFFDNQADPEWRSDAWRLIRETPNLDWLVLTKRPQNIAKMLPPDWGDGYPNVWLGTTVENQEEANRRIPALLRIPARLRFLSCEPLLGPLDLEYPEALFPNGPQMCCSGYECGCQGKPVDPPLIWRIGWIIAGGESGGHARPSHPDWFRGLRDQCAAAGVPFLFKQWGEWAPQVGAVDGWTIDDDPEASRFAHRDWDDGHWSESYWPIWADDLEDDTVSRIGKKQSGRTLDGIVHDGFPVAA